MDHAPEIAPHQHRCAVARTSRWVRLIALFAALLLVLSACATPSTPKTQTADASINTGESGITGSASTAPPLEPTVETEPTPSAEPTAAPDPTAAPTSAVAPTAAPGPTAVPPTPGATTTAVPQPSASPTPEPPPSLDLIGFERVPDLCVSGISASLTVSIRSAPSPDARSVATLGSTECGITRLGPISDGWAPVQAWEGRALQSGYIEVAFLEPGPPGSTPPFMSDLVAFDWCVVGITAPDVLNLRIAPSVDAPILDELVPNQCRIFPTGRTDATGRWLQVSVDQTSLGGWVAANFLEATLLDYPRASGSTERLVTLELTNTQQIQRFPFPDYEVRVLLPGELLAGTDGVGRKWLLGYLDPSGTISLPIEIDPTDLVVTAYRPDDRYCAFNGSPQLGADGRYEVPGFMLCV